MLSFSIEKADYDLDTYIAMLNEGNCTFVLKVKHAQDVGAKAVVIANNVEGQYIKKTFSRIMNLEAT